MSAYPKRAVARLSPMRVLPITIALALAIPFAHASEPSPSIQALTERLQALERRLGVTPDDTVATDTLDLDQRLRVIERRLELQAEETAAKAAKDPVTIANKTLKKNNLFPSFPTSPLGMYTKATLLVLF